MSTGVIVALAAVVGISAWVVKSQAPEVRRYLNVRKM